MAIKLLHKVVTLSFIPLSIIKLSFFVNLDGSIDERKVFCVLFGTWVEFFFDSEKVLLHTRAYFTHLMATNIMVAVAWEKHKDLQVSDRLSHVWPERMPAGAGVSE